MTLTYSILGHQHAATGAFNATVQISDGGTASQTVYSTVTVYSGTNITANFEPPSSPQQGYGLSNVAVAEFEDSNPIVVGASPSAVIDWGDGATPTAGTVTADGQWFYVSGSHTYQTAGHSAASVTFTDSAGATAQAAGDIDVGAVTPTGPASVDASVDTNGVTLSWTNTAAYVQTFDVAITHMDYQDSYIPCNTQLGSVNATGPGSYSYTATGLAPGHDYTFTVTPVNYDKVGGGGTAEAVVPLPSAPTIVGVGAPNGSNAAVQWTYVAAVAAGFQISDSVNGGPFLFCANVGGASRYCAASAFDAGAYGFTSGASVNFEVEATGFAGTATASAMSDPAANAATMPSGSTDGATPVGIQTEYDNLTDDAYFALSRNDTAGTAQVSVPFFVFSTANPADYTLTCSGDSVALSTDQTTGLLTGSVDIPAGSMGVDICPASDDPGIWGQTVTLALQADAAHLVSPFNSSVGDAEATADITDDSAPTLDLSIAGLDDSLKQDPGAFLPVSDASNYGQDAAAVTATVGDGLGGVAGPLVVNVPVNLAVWLDDDGILTQLPSDQTSTLDAAGISGNVNLVVKAIAPGEGILTAELYSASVSDSVDVTGYTPVLTVCDYNATANSLTAGQPPLYCELTVPEQQNGTAAIDVAPDLAAPQSEKWQVGDGSWSTTGSLASGGNNIALPVDPGDTDDVFEVKCAMADSQGNVDWNLPDQEIWVHVFDPTMMVSTILNNQATGSYLTRPQLTSPGAYLPVDNNNWDYAMDPGTGQQVLDNQQKGAIPGDDFLLPITLPAVPGAPGATYNLNPASWDTTTGHPTNDWGALTLWSNSNRTGPINCNTALKPGATVYVEAMKEEPGAAKGPPAIFETLNLNGIAYDQGRVQVSVFKMGGPMDVPGGGTYTYWCDGSAGSWDWSPLHGKVQNLTYTGTLAQPSSSATIKWNNEAAVGLALYKASPNYTWGWGVNVVQVTFDALTFTPGALVGQSAPGTSPEISSDTAFSSPPYGMSFSGTVTLTGPAPGGPGTIQRGVKYIEVGLVQNAHESLMEGVFSDGESLWNEDAEGRGWALDSTATVLPWYDGTLGAGRQIGSPAPTSATPLTLSTSDSPGDAGYPFLTKHDLWSLYPTLVRQFSQVAFRDFILADTTLDPGTGYVTVAYGEWQFTASGTFNASGKWAPAPASWAGGAAGVFPNPQGATVAGPTTPLPVTAGPLGFALRTTWWNDPGAYWVGWT